MSNKWKQILSAALALYMLGNAAAPSAFAEEAAPVEVAAVQPTEAPTPEPTEAPTPEPTEAPTPEAAEEPDAASPAPETEPTVQPEITQAPSATQEAAATQVPEATAEPESTQAPEAAEPAITGFDMKGFAAHLRVPYGTRQDQLGLPDTVDALWSDGSRSEIGVSWACVSDGLGGSAYAPMHKNPTAVFRFQAQIASDLPCEADLPVVQAAYIRPELREADVLADEPALRSDMIFFLPREGYDFGLSRSAKDVYWPDPDYKYHYFERKIQEGDQLRIERYGWFEGLEQDEEYILWARPAGDQGLWAAADEYETPKLKVKLAAQGQDLKALQPGARLTVQVDGGDDINADVPDLKLDYDYRWLRDGSACGGNTPEMDVPAEGASEGERWSCVVSDGENTVQTEEAVVSLEAASPEAPVEGEEEITDPEAPAEGEEGEGTDPEAPVEGEEGEGTDPEVPVEGEEGEETDPEAPVEGEEGEETDPEVPAEGEEGEGTDPEAPVEGEEGEEADPEAPAEGEEGEETDPEVPVEGEELVMAVPVDVALDEVEPAPEQPMMMMFRAAPQAVAPSISIDYEAETIAVSIEAEGKWNARLQSASGKTAYATGSGSISVPLRRLLADMEKTDEEITYTFTGETETITGSFTPKARPAHEEAGVTVEAAEHGVDFIRLSCSDPAWQPGLMVNGSALWADGDGYVRGLDADTVYPVALRMAASNAGESFASGCQLLEERSESTLPGLQVQLSLSEGVYTAVAEGADPQADLEYSWFSVDPAGAESAIAAQADTLVLTPEVQKALFMRRLKVTVRSGAEGAEASDLSESWHAEGMHAEIDYINETIIFTAPAAPGVDCVLHGGEAALAWAADTAALTLPLAELGLPLDAQAEVDFVLVHEPSGVQASGMQLAVPAREAYSGADAAIQLQHTGRQNYQITCAPGVQITLSADGASAADAQAYGLGPAFSLNAGAAYDVWARDAAVAGQRFASRWSESCIFEFTAADKVKVKPSLKSDSLQWKPNLDIPGLRFDVSGFGKDDYSAKWVDGNGKTISKPQAAGEYTLKISLTDQGAKHFRLTDDELDFTITPLKMTASNTAVSCEAMVYNGQDQLPKQLKLTVDEMEIPSGEFTLTKLDGREYKGAGDKIVRLSGNGSLKGKLDILYVIDPARASLKVNSAQKTQGEADPEFTASLKGMIGADTVIYSLSREPGEEPGQYAINASIDTPNPNYKVVVTAGKLTIIADENAPSPTATPTPSYDYSSAVNWGDNAEKEDHSVNGSGQLASTYFGTSDTDALVILYNALNKGVDYEMMPILRQGAQLPNGEAAPAHTFLVLAQPDDGGQAVSRTLRMRLSQLDYLYREMEFASLQLRNGNADALVPIRDVLSGNAAKLAAHMLSAGAEPIDLLDLDFEKMPPASLSAADLKALQLELRMEPMILTEISAGAEIQRDAWDISLWLCSGSNRTEISTLVPGFTIGFDVQSKLDPANPQAVLEKWTVALMDEFGEPLPLNVQLRELPDLLPEGQADSAEHYQVSMPLTSRDDVWTVYTAKVKLSKHRVQALATPYSGAGAYMLREKET